MTLVGFGISCHVQYKLDATPEPSDEDDESSDEEGDGFGAKKKEVEEDPVARMIYLEKPSHLSNISLQKLKRWPKRL